MALVRRSGILLHPTSLPGPHGCGDLGPSARHFVDWLATGGQTLWQMLPLGGIGPGNSPYMSPSAFAGNPLLIDLAQLRDAGWLVGSDLAPVSGLGDRRVDYPTVQEFRMARLRRATGRFFTAATAASRRSFREFCAATDWLDDYALFMALAATHGDAWQNWPAPLARREPTALKAATEALATEIGFHKFCQWCFAKQWAALKDYAGARGVAIVGDVPIFVAAASADVWAHPELFDLDPDGWPRVVAGVPPDYFSATGQRWGNPLYHWPTHAASGYRWWIARMRRSLELCDIARIDHFRGFESYWEIPANAETAIAGRWRPGPGAELFAALHAALGDGPAGLPIIAEDLGVITRKVRALRESLGLPGMRILQFAFDGKPKNPYLPHNFEANTVVYTGTHDNDTTRGWWESLAEPDRNYVRAYLGCRGEAIHWELIHAASASVAALAIFPMQDVLGLDASHRMNRPGCGHSAWEWRFTWDQVGPEPAHRLAELARLHGRRPGRAEADDELEDVNDGETSGIAAPLPGPAA